MCLMPNVLFFFFFFEELQSIIYITSLLLLRPSQLEKSLIVSVNEFMSGLLSVQFKGVVAFYDS